MTSPPAGRAPSPSWTVPIAVGALQALIVLWLVFGLLAPLAGAEFGGASLCVCAVFMLPLGIVPATSARRRDPSLVPAQGFAIAFIAIGIGSVLWAGPAIAAGSPPDARTVRSAIFEAQERLPEDQRLSTEVIDGLVATIVDLAPYMPAIVATIVTLVAGFVGMLAVAFRTRRDARGPPSPSTP